METVPTDFVDGYSSEEDGAGAASQSKVWGRLYPVGTSFTAIGRFGKLNGTIVPLQLELYRTSFICLISETTRTV